MYDGGRNITAMGNTAAIVMDNNTTNNVREQLNQIKNPIEKHAANATPVKDFEDKNSIIAKIGHTTLRWRKRWRGTIRKGRFVKQPAYALVDRDDRAAQTVPAKHQN